MKIRRWIDLVLLLALLSLSGAAESACEPNMEIIVPDEYVQSGTLPVYGAEKQAFGEVIRPEWFNGSGIASQVQSSRGATVVFHDGGNLRWTDSTIYYITYDGVYQAISFDGGPGETLPKPTMAAHAAMLAGQMLSAPSCPLEQTALSRITLAEARSFAEALLARLGMEGYACTAALDMSVARIRQAGAALHAAIDSGEYSTNDYRYHYALVTPADEGYYLAYHKFGTDGDLAAAHSAAFYITAQGVMYANLWEVYTQGERLYTPPQLLSAQDAAALLPGAIAASRWPETLLHIRRATLTWTPCPDGGRMVMRPVWLLAYTTAESLQKGSSACWAVFDAISGQLQAAIFE